MLLELSETETFELLNEEPDEVLEICEELTREMSLRKIRMREDTDDER